MAAESCYTTLRSSTIHYQRFGQGPEWLFCFHGYGESGQSFGLFEQMLGNRYTLVAIDMPFHGGTEWQEGLCLSVTDLVTIIQQIKPSGPKIHLLGYSMGGRIALQLALTIPEQIGVVVLAAPDGLHRNKWQWLSTQTYAGNQLFRYLMRKPQIMFGFLNTVGKLGLFNKNRLKFIHYYLDDAEQRQMLYRRWTTLRAFRPPHAALRKAILEYRIPLHLFFGKHDSMILSRHGTTFSKNCGELVQVTVLEAGHQLLKEKYVPLLANCLVE